MTRIFQEIRSNFFEFRVEMLLMDVIGDGNPKACGPELSHRLKVVG
jgi:hypothetical protein